MRVVRTPSKSLSAGTHPELVLQANEVVVECVDQIDLDGALDDGVAVPFDPSMLGIDVDLHGSPFTEFVRLRAYCAGVARKKRTKRPDNFYELLTCGWKGHALVGTDVAHIAPEDSMLVT